MARYATCATVLLGWLLIAATVLPVGSQGSGGGVTPVDDYPAVLIDSLLASSAFDSLAVLVPPILDRSRSQGDSPALAHLLYVTGRVELVRGNSNKAMADLGEAMRVAETVADTSRWMDALGFAGIAATFQGRYTESICFNQKRLSLAQLTGEPVSEAWARTGMGYVYLRTGEFEQAREQYEISAGLFRELGMTRAELTPLVGLGRVLNAMQLTDDARDCYRRVLRTARELDDFRQESDALNNLGTLEYQFGDMSVAAEYFESARELNREQGYERGTVIPATNVALARSYLGQYADAAVMLDAALASCEAGGYDDLVGMVLCTFGQVRLAQQRSNESARLYRSALSLGDILTKKQRDDATYGLARALAAMDSVAAAAGVVEAGLASGPTPEFEPLMGSLLSKCLRRLDRADEAVFCAEAAVRPSVGEAAIEAILAGTFELSAAYAAAGNAAAAYDWYFRGLSELDAFRHSTDEYEWREAHGRIGSVVDGGGIVLNFPPGLSYRNRVENLFGVLQQFKARTLAERITEPRDRVDPTPPLSAQAQVDLDALQQDVLRAGEVFVDFTVGEEITWAFVVTRDSCRVYSLAGAGSDLHSMVTFYLESIGGADTRVGPGVIDTMGAALYDELLGPAGDLLEPATRVIVAPDSYLSAIPFGVLVVNGKDGYAALMETKEIYRVPSASVLAWLRNRAAGGSEPGTGQRVLVVVPRGSGELRGASREVGMLRRRVDNVGVVTGKPSLAPGELGGPDLDVIHVAAHIVVNDEKPWHSGILLESFERPINADSSSAPTDPYLRAGEIASQSVAARVAVLSGCESALGRMSRGEGVLGLTSAFLSAGVQGVVATLWPVNDDVTADLMAEFYDRLLSGESLAVALGSAQKAIRGRERTRHPFYWAGFVVVGDGGITVGLSRAPTAPAKIWAGIGAVMLLLAITISFYLRSRRRKLRGAV